MIYNDLFYTDIEQLLELSSPNADGERRNYRWVHRCGIEYQADILLSNSWYRIRLKKCLYIGTD